MYPYSTRELVNVVRHLETFPGKLAYDVYKRKMEEHSSL